MQFEQKYVWVDMSKANVNPVNFCVCVMWRRHAVIMSVFLQGTDRDVNAVMKFPLSSLWTGVFFFFKQLPRGHILPNLLCFVKMWRVIVRRISTILGPLFLRLWAGCNDHNRKCYCTVCCLLQHLWQVEACFAAPILVEAQPPHLGNQLATKKYTIDAFGWKGQKGVFTDSPSRGKTEQKTLHQS